MNRVIALLERPAETPRADWNAALREKTAQAVAEQTDASFAALYVIDDLAATISLGRCPFEAALELGGLDGDPQSALAALGTHHAYAVEQRRVKSYPRDWSDGERSPGVFMLSSIYRIRSIDAAGFDAHWRDNHAPLALRHHVGMWEYRQNAIRQALTPGAPGYDGIALLGFATPDDFRERLYDSPEGRRVIGEDIPRFIDLKRSPAAMMAEYVLRS